MFHFKPKSGGGVDKSQSVSAVYAYNASDSCFVNVAHLGTVTSHVMHAWLGYAYEIGGTIDRYSASVTYSKGDRVVEEFADTAGYSYCVVYEYINDAPGKGKSPPTAAGGENSYWKSCNGSNGENIYVKDYFGKDSPGPFPAISAVD